MTQNYTEKLARVGTVKEVALMLTSNRKAHVHTNYCQTSKAALNQTDLNKIY